MTQSGESCAQTLLDLAASKHCICVAVANGCQAHVTASISYRHRPDSTVLDAVKDQAEIRSPV